MERQDVPVVICLNKEDLGQEERNTGDRRNLFCLRLSGPCHKRREKTGDPETGADPEGQDNYRGRSLGSREKSSLTNLLAPHVQMETGGDQQETGKRKTYHPAFSADPHRWRYLSYGHSGLYFFLCGRYGKKRRTGAIIFRNLHPMKAPAVFRDVLITHEPGCKVKEALQEGKVQFQKV